MPDNIPNSSKRIQKRLKKEHRKGVACVNQAILNEKFNVSPKVDTTVPEGFAITKAQRLLGYRQKNIAKAKAKAMSKTHWSKLVKDIL